MVEFVSISGGLKGLMRDHLLLFFGQLLSCDVFESCFALQVWFVCFIYFSICLVFLLNNLLWEFFDFLRFSLSNYIILNNLIDNVFLF
jgi:hypothetical protein